MTVLTFFRFNQNIKLIYNDCGADSWYNLAFQNGWGKHISNELADYLINKYSIQ